MRIVCPQPATQPAGRSVGRVGVCAVSRPVCAVSRLLGFDTLAVVALMRIVCPQPATQPAGRSVGRVGVCAVSRPVCAVSRPSAPQLYCHEAQGKEAQETPDVEPFAQLGGARRDADAAAGQGLIVGEEGQVEQQRTGQQPPGEERRAHQGLHGRGSKSAGAPFAHQPDQHRQPEIGGQVPGVDDRQRAQDQRQRQVEAVAGGRGHDIAGPGPPALSQGRRGAPGAGQHAPGQRQEEHREADADHVRVQIGEEKAPVGKLVDGLRDHPAGVPVGVGGEPLRAEHLDQTAGRGHGCLKAGQIALEGAAGQSSQLAHHLRAAVHVAQHGDEEGGQKRDQGGAALTGGWGVRVAGRFRRLIRRFGRALGAAAPGQVVGQAPDVDHGQGEDGGDGQVEGDGGGDAGQLDQQRDQIEAVVIVVDHAAGEVGVQRREIRAAQDGVEKGELHELFAAVPGLPDVGVGDAEGDEEQEGGREQRLAAQDQPLLLTPELRHGRAPAQPEDQ